MISFYLIYHRLFLPLLFFLLNNRDKKKKRIIEATIHNINIIISLVLIPIPEKKLCTLLFNSLIPQTPKLITIPVEAANIPDLNLFKKQIIPIIAKVNIIQANLHSTESTLTLL